MDILPLLVSQRIVQICLFLFSAIALFGGGLQMYLGQPETAARLDNVHRFMAGIYFGCGLICLWAALTIRDQNTLVFLIAFSVFLAGCGRLLSMSKVGLPEPRAVWLGYLIPELVVPWVMAIAQIIHQSRRGMTGRAYGFQARRGRAPRNDNCWYTLPSLHPCPLKSLIVGLSPLSGLAGSRA